MANILKITGVNTVVRNMMKAKGVIARDVARGLKKGGLHLVRATDKYVPVDLGNLKGSRFVRNVGGSGFKTDIIVGFTADYAVYVHENLEARHGARYNEYYGTAGDTLRGSEQQAKFLERPAREEKRAIIKIIQKEARI